MVLIYKSLKLAQWFWRRIFLNSFVFLLFRNYLPLEKDVVFHLNKFEGPSPKDALYQVLVEIGTVVLEKEMKMWNIYRQTDGRTDGQKEAT